MRESISVVRVRVSQYLSPTVLRSDKEPDADQGKSRECCLFQAKVKTRDTEICGIQTVGKRIVKNKSKNKGRCAEVQEGRQKS